MSEPEPPTEAFAADLKRLGGAFGREIKGGLLAEFHRVFGEMSAEDYRKLVDWAIQNLDAPFPTIARLRKGALQLGLLKPNGKLEPRQPPGTKEFPFVYVECPRCEGTFVVFKSRLVEYARQDAIFECVNRMHWGCPVTFRARDIADRELKNGGSQGGIQ